MWRKFVVVLDCVGINLVGCHTQCHTYAYVRTCASVIIAFRLMVIYSVKL